MLKWCHCDCVIWNCFPEWKGNGESRTKVAFHYRAEQSWLWNWSLFIRLGGFHCVKQVAIWNMKCFLPNNTCFTILNLFEIQNIKSMWCKLIGGFLRKFSCVAQVQLWGGWERSKCEKGILFCLHYIHYPRLIMTENYKQTSQYYTHWTFTYNNSIASLASIRYILDTEWLKKNS